jgi:hypothetical protein
MITIAINILPITIKTTIMKKIRIFYWVFTSLFAIMMLGSAIPDILVDPIAVEGMHKGLGYQVYFIPFIGVMKAAGVVAILVPGYARLKEWAYAGLVFDLVGATFSIIASGQAPNAIGMCLPLSLAAASYIFYHKKLRAESKMRTKSTAASQESWVGTTRIA